MDTKDTIPITVFTGFLGAGKTTIILDLIQKFPKDYKVVLLKNEFGDVKVDSALTNSQIQVTEMLNGCLCCVLVGQMKNALLEIKETQKPDRIIIETSGSAFPAPIAWQIREIADQGFHLDSIITVVDAVNFKGYADTSYTAKLQAQYTDLILLNKHELVTERELDLVIDDVNELNTDTPKLKWDAHLSLDVFFGIDTKLFQLSEQTDQVDENHHEREIDLIHIQQSTDQFNQPELEVLLSNLPKEDVYRVKGLFPSNNQTLILNWAFGRWIWTPINEPRTDFQCTVMGIGLRMVMPKFKSLFPDATIKLSPASPRH